MNMEFSEPLRPLYHFSVPKGWLNDPNGMVYYDGEYHLFYQYYPHDTVWGPMHWGHAVSTDMVNWTHLPIALYPDDLGYIFSGGAVIDWHNTAGFGAEALVVFYTYHDPKTENQSQALAYSLDNGRSWTKYEGNPVIPTPRNLKNFRDPKVLWYEDENGGGHWVMIVAAGDAVSFYTSHDLINWQISSQFGFDQGATTGVWETPDMFKLAVQNSQETRWILTVGLGEGAPAGGSGMQYFVGTFDGAAFLNENPKEKVLWADYGADFYAAQSWSDTKDTRQLWLAWMNDWRYALKIPTTTWRGSMTLPREARLTQHAAGIRMVQSPIKELEQLRLEGNSWQDVTILANSEFVPDVSGRLLEIVANLEVNVDASEFGVRVYSNPEEFTTVGIQPDEQIIYVDRTHAGISTFHESFCEAHRVEHVDFGKKVQLHLFVDSSSIELFVDDGVITFSERIFPNSSDFHLRFFAVGADIAIKDLDIFLLDGANFLLSS